MREALEAIAQDLHVKLWALASTWDLAQKAPSGVGSRCANELRQALEDHKRFLAQPKSEPEGPQDLSDEEWNMLPALLKAADDLCFDCDGVLGTKAPRREIYNLAFAAIKSAQERNLIPRMLAHRAQPAVSRADADPSLREAMARQVMSHCISHGATADLQSLLIKTVLNYSPPGHGADAEPRADAPLVAESCVGATSGWLFVEDRIRDARVVVGTEPDDVKKHLDAAIVEIEKIKSGADAPLDALRDERGLLQRVLDEHDGVSAASLACPECEKHAARSNPLCLIHSIRAALAAAPRDRPETRDEYRARIDAEMEGARNFFSWMNSSDRKEEYALAESFAGIRQGAAAAPRDQNHANHHDLLISAAQKYREAERHPQLEGLADALESLKTAALAAPLVAPVARLDEMQLVIEFDKEDDGRCIADIPAHPGVMAYGLNKGEALTAVVRVLCERMIDQACGFVGTFKLTPWGRALEAANGHDADGDWLILLCPTCGSFIASEREPHDPPEATLMEVQCPTCNEGDFDSPGYWDSEGHELGPKDWPEASRK